jgi:hypothetical protein
LLVTSGQVAAALAAGRNAARLLMRDTVLIERRTAQTFDSASGLYVDTWTTVYLGPADVKPLDQQARSVDAGQTLTATGRYDVKIPFGDDAEIKVEDRVTATATADQHLLQRPLYVVAVGLGARRTARHITAVDQEQP